MRPWNKGSNSRIYTAYLGLLRCRNYRRSHKWKATRGFAEALWWPCCTAASSRGLVLAGPLPCAAEDLLSNLCSSSVHLPSCPQSPGTGISLEFFTKSQSSSATTEPFCHGRRKKAYLRFSSAGNWLSLPKAFASFPPLGFLRFFTVHIIRNTKSFNWASVGKLIYSLFHLKMHYMLCR